MPNVNFFRTGTREVLNFFFVAMVEIFFIAMVMETVLATNRYCPS